MNRFAVVLLIGLTVGCAPDTGGRKVEKSGAEKRVEGEPAFIPDEVLQASQRKTLEMIQFAAELYEIDMKRKPRSIDELAHQNLQRDWQGPYLDEVPADCLIEDGMLIHIGKDRKQDTADDVIIPLGRANAKLLWVVREAGAQYRKDVGLQPTSIQDLTGDNGEENWNGPYMKPTSKCIIDGMSVVHHGDDGEFGTSDDLLISLER